MNRTPPMKFMIVICSIALLCACSSPNFVGDAAPVPVTSTTPDHFELPARFAVARYVYGQTQTSGAKEAALWTDLAHRAKDLGSFTPLISSDQPYQSGPRTHMIESARQQRYTYLLVVRMNPSEGSADVSLVHVGSGGVMATAQATSPSGGQKGFWGGRINNPARLDRQTLKIAQSTLPIVEEMLRGAALRQR